MTSTNKLIEIKYINEDTSEFFECYKNVSDFLEEIKEKFGLTKEDFKENKITFYYINEKEKKQIDINKDYNKFILNNNEIIINLELENKNYKKKTENNNEIIENNNIKNQNKNLLKSSIIKDQIKTILDKNNEYLLSNFSNNLNELNTKINSIEKQMIDINKNIQNVPNLLNQTFSIQFPQIEQKITRKIINFQKMIVSLLKNNKNEINNILDNINNNILNTSVNTFNDRNNNNNYDILLENHNKLKDELSNKNKIEADLKTKIKDLEKKIETNNLSQKNKENDYIKKMKDNLNKNKILQENEKKLKNEIYLLKEQINKLNNSNNNFFDIKNSDNKNNGKKNKNNDSENNSFESINNSEEKERINSDESDSKEDDNENNNKNNNKNNNNKNNIKNNNNNKNDNNKNKNNNNNNNDNNNNDNNDNKKFKNIFEESFKYEYEFVPKEITYSIEKSKLKELNNKSVNFNISIKNYGKTPIPINSYIYNENMNNNNLFKFYCRISKEIKPNKTENFIGKMIISNNNYEIKQNYRLVLKLFNNFKKEYNDSKCVLNINIINEKNKNKSIIKKLNNQQIKIIIDEINDFFKDQKNALKKFDLKQEIEDLMNDENFQNFDSFDDLKEKILGEITDKIYS